MENIKKILIVDRQKIPSWKDDIVQNLAMQTFALPRKTHISGHFHLNTIKNREFCPCNRLIF